MPDIGLPELIVILVILLLLFGSTKLPKLARSLGQSAKELRDGLHGPLDSESKSEPKSADKQPEQTS